MLVLDYHQLVAISLHGSQCDEQSNGAVPSVGEPGIDGGREPDWEVAEACMEALGPNGNGFVAVKGMNNYSTLRGRLLRLAQKLALMPNLERAAIMKEHGLGSDVPLKDPGRPVSSFAAQLRFGSPPELGQVGPASSADHSGVKAHWSTHGDGFGGLGSLFKQLGMCMVEVGLLIARVCDAARPRGSMREARLEEAILDSGTAKGRLVHYHSLLDQEILSSLRKDLREGYDQLKSARTGRKAQTSDQGSDSGDFVSTWWQQWHYDYGIFTVLTSPLFLQPVRAVPLEPDNAMARSCCLKDALSGQLETDLETLDLNSSRLLQQRCDRPHTKAEKEEKPGGAVSPQPRASASQQVDWTDATVQECAPPDGHSSLLVMDSNGAITPVTVPSDHLIIQVGEAAQLLTGGELVARAHCVRRPRAGRDVSRETMAVFLQPAWGERMSLPRGVPREQVLAAGRVGAAVETHVPPLGSRWTEGCTFADLAGETTRQSYGADGRRPAAEHWAGAGAGGVSAGVAAVRWEGRRRVVDARRAQRGARSSGVA